MSASATLLSLKQLTSIRKRDGRIVIFDSSRIERALQRCFAEFESVPALGYARLVDMVVNLLRARLNGDLPTVEGIQDAVETVLLSTGELDAVRHYIRYRDDRQRQRTEQPVSQETRDAFAASKSYFPHVIQEVQFYDKYSRFDHTLGRRETWEETVSLRAVPFLRELAGDRPVPEEVLTAIERGVLRMQVIPSMRLLAMAGTAARRNNVSCYNCAYLPVKDLDSFVEAMSISMAGCGVGYSVEEKHVHNLPRVAKQRRTPNRTPYFFEIQDSQEGWEEALRFGLYTWFDGDDVVFDFSKIRPAGTVLRTKGGRACLTGDTIVYKDKKKSKHENTITLAQLYEKRCKTPRRLKHIKIRSLNEATGAFYRNRVLDVLDNGIAPVFEVLTTKGYKIRATLTHRFLKEDLTYYPLSQFSTGERIAVNGVEVKSGTCRDCKIPISRRAGRCKSCFDLAQQKETPLPTSARQRKACRDALEVFCEMCSATQTRLIVHHIDEVVTNNHPSNLLTLCEPCHHRLHAARRVFGNPYAQTYLSFDTIEHIKYVGEERVFDVCMAAPDHNFVANGFVSHNSGPEPLKRLLDFARGKIFSKQGGFLSTLDAHDIMCAVGGAAVAGGTRRTAMLAAFDGDDHAMLRCKDGDLTQNQQRWNANNSAVWDIYRSQVDVMSQMIAMHNGMRGEPGILSRYSLPHTLPARRIASGYPLDDYGTNPCLHPDSMIETIQGRVRIADIKEPSMVYTMEADGTLGVRKCSAAWVSKTNTETLTLTIASGKQIRCTPDHKIFVPVRGWVEAKDIRIGDRVAHLVRNRRGAAYSGVKLTTQDSRDFKLEHHLVWEAVNGPLPSGYDIHHIDGNTYNNSIDNLECLTHAAHAQLTALEQPNNHQVHNTFGKFTTHPNLKGGAKTIVPMPIELQSALHQYSSVIRIEQGETTDVYDLTVEGTHNFIADFVVVHNCGEIFLRNYSFCNLSAVICRPDDTFDTLAEKVKIATWIGTLQSLATHFPTLRPEWKKNCEEERLLGVDLNGQMDCAAVRDPEVLSKLKEIAVTTNREFALSLGINPSMAVTCVKPSGNSATLLGCSSGLHARYAPYYVRRLRLSAHSPIYQVLRDAGVPLSPENGQTTDAATTWVASFPIKSPEGAITRNDLTAIQQLETWKLNKVHYTEHNPSVTIYYKNEELLAVCEWLWRNQTILGGLTFYPTSDAKFDQMPYEEITKEEFEKLAAAFPQEIDFSKLTRYEQADSTTVAGEVSCAGGVCEIGG